jgi:hypothetical protein
MTEQIQSGSKLQKIRGVLEAVIVAALLWTGSSLIALREQNAVMSAQLTMIQSQLLDVPAMKLELAEHGVEITRLKEDMRDTRSVRNLK